MIFCQCIKYKYLHNIYLITLQWSNLKVSVSDFTALIPVWKFTIWIGPALFSARPAHQLETSDCPLYICRLICFIYFCTMWLLDSRVLELEWVCRFPWRGNIPCVSLHVSSERDWKCCSKEIWTRLGVHACIHYAVFKQPFVDLLFMNDLHFIWGNRKHTEDEEMKNVCFVYNNHVASQTDRLDSSLHVMTGHTRDVKLWSF